MEEGYVFVCYLDLLFHLQEMELDGSYRTVFFQGLKPLVIEDEKCTANVLDRVIEQLAITSKLFHDAQNPSVFTAVFTCFPSAIIGRTLHSISRSRSFLQP